MARCIYFLALVTVAAVVTGYSPQQPFDNSKLVPTNAAACSDATYPVTKSTPVSNTAVQTHDINLDEPAATRWNQIVVQYKAPLKALIDWYIKSVKDAANVNNPAENWFANFLVKEFDKIAPKIIDLSMPPQYKAEMQGIAIATGIPLAQVLMHNIGYETAPLAKSLSGGNAEPIGSIGCTSIVGQQSMATAARRTHKVIDDDEYRGFFDIIGTAWNWVMSLFGWGASVLPTLPGADQWPSPGSEAPVLHVRNLDYGNNYGTFNTSSGTWAMTELLRPLVFNCNFKKGGVIIYRAVCIAGQVGVMTGVKAQAYSITTNTRTNDTETLADFFQWLAAGALANKPLNNGGKWVGFTVRDLLESSTALTFAQAKIQLQTVALLRDVYFTIGGAKDGCVISRAQLSTVNAHCIGDAQGPAAQNWFVLQTNDDWWMDPKDARRAQGLTCMMKKAQGRGVTQQSLYQVLSTTPNLNEKTIFTTLMNVQTGTLETVIRKCTAANCNSGGNSNF